MKKRITTALAVLLVALLLFVATPRAFAAGNPNPRILPPDSRPHWLSYGEWSAKWWQYVFAIPASTNPLFDETGAACGVGQSGHVWFLAEVLNTSGEAERTCTIPSGTMLFVPILTVECSTLEPPPFFGRNETELRTCAQSFRMSDLHATIDGVAIQNPEAYTVSSPLFTFTVPGDNILGVSSATGQSMANGAYLMIAPLSVGDHTIQFGGSFPDAQFTVNVTYHLTVAPRGQF